MVTDSLRALLFEACGYKTKVFEFIALEHTNKNESEVAPQLLGHRQSDYWRCFGTQYALT